MQIMLPRNGRKIAVKTCIPRHNCRLLNQLNGSIGLPTYVAQRADIRGDAGSTWANRVSTFRPRKSKLIRTMIRSIAFFALLLVCGGLTAPMSVTPAVESVILVEETGRFLAISADGRVSADADMSKQAPNTPRSCRNIVI